MLTFAEDILLLLIDEKRGNLVPIPDRALSYVLAGAALMDLALADRIDTDLEHLMLSDSTPLDDDILDPVLAEIAQTDELHNTRFWLDRIAGQADEIREQALNRLVARGILETEEGGFFWFVPGVSETRSYSISDEAIQEEVRMRIMRVLFNNDIPDPHDIVLICLANVCGIFEHLLSPVTFELVKDRIDLISRLDLIGQSVIAAIRQSEPMQDAARPPISREIPTASFPPLKVRLKKSYREFLLKQYLELGPIFQIKKGEQRLIFLAGPEGNKFFAKYDKTHFRSREFWMKFDEQFDSSRSILSMVGEEHFRLRRIKKPGYSCAMGEIQVPDIIDVVRSEIASWPTEKPISGTTMSKRLVYNLSARILTGVSAPEYFEDLSQWLNTSILYMDMDNWYGKRQLKKPRHQQARKRLEELAEKIIAAHQPENRGDHPPNIIDDLLALHRTDPQFLPETDLKLAVIEPLWIPMDTTGHATSFLLYFLMKDPDLQARIKAEADALFAQGMPTAQEIHQLDVLSRAVMETLRMYPPLAAFRRTVSNSFEFEGYTVPAGESVAILFGLSHYIPEYFPDPERFDIDRYAPPRNEHKTPFVYAPYALGTHRCLGGHLAEFLMTVTMATIFHDADIALHPPNYALSHRKVNPLPTYHPDKSFKFRLLGKRST